jgi:hypothetical protein
MGPLRRREVSGRGVIVVVAFTAALLALALTGAIGSATNPRASARNTFASHRFGFSASLPEGWNRSAQRLVPLLMPREVLSVGTGAMPVGGGGNCGREPVAAIARMKPGDALVSIQEYTVTRRMRPRLAQTFPLLSAYSGLGRLDLRRQLDLRRHPGPLGEQSPSSPTLWSATLPFRDHGRAFDALVYLKGPPSRELLGQIASILARLDFRPTAQMGLPGSTDAHESLS